MGLELPTPKIKSHIFYQVSQPGAPAVFAIDFHFGVLHLHNFSLLYWSSCQLCLYSFTHSINTLWRPVCSRVQSQESLGRPCQVLEHQILWCGNKKCKMTVQLKGRLDALSFLRAFYQGTPVNTCDSSYLGFLLLLSDSLAGGSKNFLQRVWCLFWIEALECAVKCLRGNGSRRGNPFWKKFVCRDCDFELQLGMWRMRSGFGFGYHLMVL